MIESGFLRLMGNMSTGASSVYIIMDPEDLFMSHNLAWQSLTRSVAPFAGSLHVFVYTRSCVTL